MDHRQHISDHHAMSSYSQQSPHYGSAVKVEDDHYNVIIQRFKSAAGFLIFMPSISRRLVMVVITRRCSTRILAARVRTTATWIGTVPTLRKEGTRRYIGKGFLLFHCISSLLLSAKPWDYYNTNLYTFRTPHK